MRCGIRQYLRSFALLAAPFLFAAAPLQSQAAGGAPPVEKLQRLEALYKAGDAKALPYGRDLLAEARARYGGNARWQGEVAAFYGMALLEFGDFEEAGRHFTEALERLEEGAFYFAVRAAAAQVEEKQEQVGSWRRHYAAVLAEVRAAAEAGREPPVLARYGESLDISGYGSAGGPSFRVIEVLDSGSPELVVRIDATVLDRLDLGETGALHCSDLKGGGVAFLGIARATVISEGDHPLVRIEYREDQAQPHKIDKNVDYVTFLLALKYKYEDKDNPSVIRSMANDNIGLVSPFGGARYYDIARARVVGDSVPPNLTAARMARDIRKVAESVRAKNRHERMRDLETVLEGDPYEGLTVLDAMEQTTVTDMRVFLSMHEGMGAGKLRGYDWDLVDLYINYVLDTYEFADDDDDWWQ